jgi:tetratricopeptide (TPR) repeat protein
MGTNKKFRTLHSIAALVFLALLPLGAAAQAQPAAPSPAAQAANDLFQAKKWPEAAVAYGQIVKTSPQDGPAWYRLGLSLHSMKKWDLAAAAFERSAEIGQQPGAMYNAGAANAEAGKPDLAFQWLKKAADAGFSQPDRLKNDEDFAALRNDPRFAETLKAFAVNAEPCGLLPRYHDFDFFVGEWDVQGPAGTPPSTNSIQSITGKCILFENYTNGPYSGKSFSYYDAAIGKWRQTWVDAFGGSATFVGEYKDGVMRFEGESHPRTGPASKIRMTLFNQGPDRLRQLGESTNDEGKTWTISYDLTYTRKK